MQPNVHDMPGELYDRASEEVGNHAHEILFGLAYAHVRAGEHLLDIGIGTGLGAELFHRAGLVIDGLDSAEQMVLACRRKGIAAHLTMHDLARVPWPVGDHSHDHAIACGVLHFFGDLAPFFAEIERIVRPSGTFAFTVMERAPAEPTPVAVFAHPHELVVRLARAHSLTIEKDVAFSTPTRPGNELRVPFHAYLARRAPR